MVKSARNMSGLPWIAAMAFFMQSLDATILNTALPAIAKSLHHSPLAMQPAIVSYTLTVAMLIPVSGWLADRFGTQRIFIYAVSLFSLGSLACALSHNLSFLVISRVIQGIGGAMMMPVARLALLRTYPRSELLPILNFVTMPGLLGPILGPMLGGLLVTYATWHWIFIINIPIGLLGIIYARKNMPNLTMPKCPFDFLGFMLFGMGLVMISVSFDLFGDNSLSSYIPLVLLPGGITMLLIYIFHAKRHKNPLIDLQLFQTHTFSIGIASNIATRLSTGSLSFIIPLMLQVGFGYSAVIAGIMMAPNAIGSILAKSFVTKILTRFGYKNTLFWVTVIIGVMISQFSLQTPEMSVVLLIIPLFILGMAMSTQFTAMNTITLADLNDNNASAGNSLLAVTQQLSISFGVTVSAAVLRFYESMEYGSTVSHFHYTLITMGAITLISSTVFLFLNKEDGNNLINK
ncbi:multidrug transporter subunit MdtD [Xenorhabdus nematophila]|uniref:Permease of the major facilitator superfamily putative transmenmbrane domain n=1 Tax=Xenorhabdus nematophila (strain ATCC 19061 / DSM 3370 / CCUG 14189 / LMG 1036 / NCIMB 9965 / AN6) TaxID=406817 RepID=D3VG47_XENNA|nr:multidrug transporter subunit MdtD [Xenorhabdus nematophila]CEE89904.1 putative permease of the major facilitator superfamily; putative transmenmbrane domain [Xenorhabdus nematophila str. Anatoliense]CEF28416.1 putative permease of the major facilitator superfamily; putative transmenmbrane domain [Xenorhabdus nematophila str. Websteri]AYA41642.1 DHA2 family efflux MFS transporter permease subunit [Xenorhabdus nematophila]MBA0020379.1 multidrug transporter subunit MdtD [Xenorhabdus nematophil